jgi:hypothetical protein
LIGELLQHSPFVLDVPLFGRTPMSSGQPLSPFDPPRAPAAAIAPNAAGAPWSPRAIGWITFLFTFLPGGVMLALNWDRLGQPEKKVPTLLAVIAGFFAFCGALFFVPDNPVTDRLFNVVNVAVAITFWRLQKDLFDEHEAKGGAKGRILVPVLLSFLWVVLFVGVIIAVTMAAETDGTFLGE